MSPKRQAAFWIGLWGFWMVVSRNNHPTLLLNGLATGTLVAVFAAAVNFNWGVLVPRFWRPRRFFRYGLSLLFMVTLMTVIAVTTIQAAYDRLWGPDPRRFGFWVNFGLDFAGISLHLAVGGVILWLLRQKWRATNR